MTAYLIINFNDIRIKYYFRSKVNNYLERLIEGQLELKVEGWCGIN